MPDQKDKDNMSAYCSMIHGGLSLDFRQNGVIAAHCCIMEQDAYFFIDPTTKFWNSAGFQNLRELNKKDIWHSHCVGCKTLESTGQSSLRTGMNDGLKTDGKTDLVGPARIDLMFDISCNLACRSCVPGLSTFWQKHLKDNGLWNDPIYSAKNKDQVITTLSNIDLSNLKQLVFAGGETLLGKEYWEVAQWLADNVPNPKQLTLCFQTNGTQKINKRYYDLIERFHLVKLQISLDGVNERFEYLRWPALWNQTVDNILYLKSELPSNVMFTIEETISIFNLYYQHELDSWVKQNFATNREGDVVNHTRHLAHGIFNLLNITEEYNLAIGQKYNKKDWHENPEQIQKMIKEIAKFDLLRNQNFTKVFPEIADFYYRYL